MGNAYICDVCGKVVRIDNKIFNVNTSEKLGAHERILERKMLCDDCWDKLQTFLEGDEGSGLEEEDSVSQPPSKEAVVSIGDVKPLPAADLNDKEWPKKVLEEAAEVYSAWERYMDLDLLSTSAEDRESVLTHILYECGDTIQTCANMVYATVKELDKLQLEGVITEVDVQKLMEKIEKRNREKGRYDVDPT